MSQQLPKQTINNRTIYDQAAVNRMAVQNVKTFDYVLFPGAYTSSAPCQVVVGYNNCPYPGNTVTIEDNLRRGKWQY